MLRDETIEFLAGVAPFDQLGADELALIADDIALEYYPRGMKILAQNGPPSEHLRIIKKGGVKVFITSQDGKEINIDIRGEGEHFGLLSVMSGDRSRANVVAVEDTICYIIGRERLSDITTRNPRMNEFFFKSFFINYIDKTYEETRRRHSSGVGDSDRLLFTTTVGQIITRPPVTTGRAASIKEAAGVMADNKISSLIVVDDGGMPEGIVTDRDLREKVVARGLDISRPVTAIMTSPLISVDAEEYCFEALISMMRHKIHHMLVLEQGAFRGVVTNHDLMVLQGSSPTMLVKEMEDMQSLDSLSRTTPKLYRAVGALLRDGAKANNITGLVTELTEKLILRTFEIMERELGPSPSPYTLFIYGDGGRRELTLGMDVRLGVIYPDTNNLTLIGNVGKYFGELINRLGGSAATGMVAFADGCLEMRDVMQAADWKRRFDAWGADPETNRPEPALYDMRAIRGEPALLQDMRRHLLGVTSANRRVMDMVASEAVSNRPPLGFFKRFVVEKSGEHKNELDLGLKGIRPLVDLARVFAIEKGINELSSVRRLAVLRERHGFKHAEDMDQALNYVVTFVIHRELQQIDRGLTPGGFLNPEGLANMERKTLKETFQLVANLYEIVEHGFRTEGAA